MQTIVAIFEDGVLRAPKLGVFKARLSTGELVRPELALGTLRVLERSYLVIAPSGAAGIIERAPSAAHVAVEYREPLFVLGAARELDVVAAERRGGEARGVAVKAPIAGIFYRRASPASPPYVELGQSVARGQTVGLIEVMKTFNPVVYTGDGGVVVSVAVEDRQEVAAGEALLHVE